MTIQGRKTPAYLLLLEPNTYVIVGQPFTEVQRGIAFPKKRETGLRGAVAKAFNEMLEDGGYQAVLAKWQLESNAVAGLMINGEPVK